MPEQSGTVILAPRALRDDHDGAWGCAPELCGKRADAAASTARPATRANDDHHRRLLAGDPRELAGPVAGFRTAIGAAAEAVLARDPVEQLLTRSVRLNSARICPVGAVVAVNDM